MKVAAFVLALSSLFPSLGLAAQIYGTLRESDRPVEANVPVAVVCGNSSYPVKTDGYGSYKLHAKEQGKCTLTVTFRGQTPKTTIESFNDPAHYDFDLIRQPDGLYHLQRR